MPIGQIKCVNKQDRPNPWERITHVGGFADRQWKITQEWAIHLMENEGWSFFVEVNRDRVAVEIALSRFKNKYLKTVADGDQPNNLLSLPECP